MPLDFHKSTETFQLGIWKLEESLDELHHMLQLSEDDLRTLKNFKSEYRKREWLTVRVLVKTLLKSAEFNIAYHKNGKPLLVNSHFSISISHTKNFVAVLLTEHEAAGIDLETIQPRIEKIAKRFITPEEEQFITADKKINYQHVIWGTKETLFKIYAKGELNFLDNLHVEKFQLKKSGELTAKIQKDSFQKKYTVFYEKLNDLMLVYAID